MSKANAGESDQPMLENLKYEGTIRYIAIIVTINAALHGLELMVRVAQEVLR